MRWILRILLVLLLLPFALLAILAVLPERWLANSVERLASSVTGVDVEIDSIAVEVFSPLPGVALSGVRVSAAQEGRILESANASLSVVASELIKARVVLQDLVLEGGPLTLVRFEDGSGNWTALLSETGDEPLSGTQAASLPAIRRIVLDEFRVRIDDRMMDRQADVSLKGSGSTTEADVPFQLSVLGTYNRLPLSVDASVRIPGGLTFDLAESGLVQWDVAAELAKTTLAVDGQIQSLENLRGLDSSIVFRAPDESALEALAGLNLPGLPAIGFEGALVREGEVFLVRQFIGEIGANQVRGDMRFDPTTQPITAYVSADADVFDLDALTGSVIPKPAAALPDTDASSDVTAAQSPSWLSDDEFDLQPLTRLYNGAVRFTAQQVKSSSVPIESLDIRLEIMEQQIRLVPLDFGLGGGTIEAEVTLDVLETGAEGVAEMRLRGIDLQQVLESLGIDNKSVGNIGGRAKYGFKGNSVAGLARSADGGLFLLMSGGQLDALLVELAGLDLMESVAELIDPGKDLTPIECGYLDLLTQAGVTSIERMVLGTEDTVFIGDGRFDANTEEFDVTVEPHPKDASLLSARTSVTLSGRPGNVSVTPGAGLPARAAAIAVLATIASPAAALLPLLESGGAEESGYCNGLVSSLDDAR